MRFGEKRRTKQELEMEFDRLYRENERKVFGLAWRLTGDEEAAKDIGQKTFLTLHLKLRKVLNHPAPEGWLIQTVHYYVNNYKRNQAYRMRHEAPIELAEQLPASRPVDELEDFLELLPDCVTETEKKMLVLYYCYRYSLREIADKLGLTYNAVRARMARVHSKLRECGFDKSD